MGELDNALQYLIDTEKEEVQQYVIKYYLASFACCNGALQTVRLYLCTTSGAPLQSLRQNVTELT